MPVLGADFQARWNFHDDNLGWDLTLFWYPVGYHILRWAPQKIPKQRENYKINMGHFGGEGGIRM